MRAVTPERWAMWCDGMPMPEGATDDMLWAAYDAIREMERRDEAIEGIAFFTELLERDKKKLKLELEFGESEVTETLRSIIKTAEEIINTYRSWLQ